MTGAEPGCSLLIFLLLAAFLTEASGTRRAVRVLPSITVSVPEVEKKFADDPEERCLEEVTKHWPEFLDDTEALAILNQVRLNQSRAAPTQIFSRRQKRSTKMAAAMEPLIDNLMDLYKKGLEKRKMIRKNIKENSEKIRSHMMKEAKMRPFDFYNITSYVFDIMQELYMLRKAIRDSFTERFFRGRSPRYGLSVRSVPWRDFTKYHKRVDNAYNAAVRTWLKAQALKSKGRRYYLDMIAKQNQMRRMRLDKRMCELYMASHKALVTAWRAHVVTYYVRRDLRHAKEFINYVYMRREQFLQKLETGKKYMLYRVQRAQRFEDEKMNMFLGMMKGYFPEIKRHLKEDIASKLKPLVEQAKKHSKHLRALARQQEENLRSSVKAEVPKKARLTVFGANSVVTSVDSSKYIVRSINFTFPTDSLSWLCPSQPTDAPRSDDGSGDVDADMFFKDKRKSFQEKNSPENRILSDQASWEINNIQNNNSITTESPFQMLLRQPVTMVPPPIYSDAPASSHRKYGEMDDQEPGDVYEDGGSADGGSASQVGSGSGSRSESGSDADGSGELPETSEKVPRICRKPQIPLEKAAQLMYKHTHHMTMNGYKHHDKLRDMNFFYRLREVRIKHRKAVSELRSNPISYQQLRAKILALSYKTLVEERQQNYAASEQKAYEILDKLAGLTLNKSIPDLLSQRTRIRKIAVDVPKTQEDVRASINPTKKLTDLVTNVDVGSLVSRVVRSTAEGRALQGNITSSLGHLRAGIKKAYSLVASIKRTAMLKPEDSGQIVLTPWVVIRRSSAMSHVCVDVRTNSSHGTILRLQDKDDTKDRPTEDMTLHLRKGIPNLSWRYYGARRRLATDKRVNDGEWHRLRIDRVGAALKLSDQMVGTNHIRATQQRIPMEAAARPLTPFMRLGKVNYDRSSISGCIKDYKVNGFLLPLVEFGRNWTKCPDGIMDASVTGSGDVKDEFFTTSTKAPGYMCMQFDENAEPYRHELDTKELDSFSFSFKSDRDRSVLMSYSLSPRHYLMVYMYGGMVWINGRTRTGYFRKYCRRPSVRPGRWHTFKLHKMSYLVAVYLDHQRCDYIPENALMTKSTNGGTLILGSVGTNKNSPLASIAWIKAFQGWMKEFIVNDKMVNFVNNPGAKNCIESLR